MIQRFSSRRHKISEHFLNKRLANALAYDRIAGYFSSSIIEVAGETIESIQGKVRMVCNSELNVRDVETAKAAQYGMRKSWCNWEPEKLNEKSKARFLRLYEFLKSKKLEVKVLPNEKFGLIHGKAGVISLSDGNKTTFLGSVNESYHAWKLNYELLWEDDSPEAVNWVQEEFNALWESPFAIKLADFVIEDIGRLSKRKIIWDISKWREEPEPATTIVETPVYRKEYGLWEHQKYFVKMAFDAHMGLHGARYVLADQVGLGKTVQLALSAMLMALHGDKPILILLPKPLLWQWQTEMNDLLDTPSAIWTNKAWIDENGIDHPVSGLDGVLKCPRRIGLISQGLITSKSEIAVHLKKLRYECIIVDEAHRARRKNLGPTKHHEKPDPNNLLEFLLEISERTKSLLLATGTPVQLFPIEAWDLLNILSGKDESVLGNAWSQWRRKPADSMDIVSGLKELPDDDIELWSWIRNPLPQSNEGPDFSLIRQSLKLNDSEAVAPGDCWDKLPPSDKVRIKQMRRSFASNHNPFIRHIVRRTRNYLEQTINPDTNEPYLKPVTVNLHGEGDRESILLPTYLREAYRFAESFCRQLSERIRGFGFMKTLLLRRIGSTIYAGRLTAEKILREWKFIDFYDQDYGDDYEQETALSLLYFKNDSNRTLTPEEKRTLESLIDSLNANQEKDPKYKEVLKYLLDQNWLNFGCIIFSQYYDSIEWLATQLSKEGLLEESIGIYAGGTKSGIMENGIFRTLPRESLKQMVSRGELRLLLGTDAASEGLNLQRLGTLINLDLPWNPTRLEQRKGRIQRIGQLRDTVDICNLRYKDSVEDRVHDLLSERLESIYALFGQIPDMLEDVWINVALGEIQKAKQTIDAVPNQHPFEIKYHKIERIDWESCYKVLDNTERKRYLLKSW